MSGFDEGAVYTAPGPGQPRADELEDADHLMRAGADIDRQLMNQVQDIIANGRKFILEFRRSELNFPYREALRTNYEQGRYYLELDIEDLRGYDRSLYRQLSERPVIVVPLLERAAREVLDELTQPRPPSQDRLPEMQLLFRTSGRPESLRMLGAEHVQKLVKIHGIIVSASSVKARAIKLTLQCRSCRATLPEIEMKHGFESYALPRKCFNSDANTAAGRPPCPMDPYFIVPDKCACVDIQTLKLQENPTEVPVGEMPRHMTLYCERAVTDRVVPGNRVTALGIYAIKSFGKADQQRSAKVPYVRVLGLQVDSAAAAAGLGATVGGSYSSGGDALSDDQKESFRQFAASGHAYKTIVASIAPSIYGYDDIKKAIACLLFAGSRKRLPDGLPRRGDINVLLLGDPGVAKSQLLKFVERVAPIGVYTSGKGSSAAGLTAAVLRDPTTNSFTIEGGAMVLADGGVVCIDEFDKMRDEDRVAIHEAMEQQTISIAKAGITTTLNSRCAVLAAANSVYGRWDDTKGDENIDLMPTILSRFDMIFLVKDVHDVERDTTLAKHVMNVHMHTRAAERDDTAAAANVEADEEAEELDFTPGKPLPMRFLRNFISYCRAQCGPRLTEPAAQKLRNQFVAMRSSVHDKTAQAMRDTKGKFHSIPITVRQLEAVVRISEALAKMELRPFATEEHVDEALRLFQVSTLNAAISGCLAGIEEFTSNVDQEMLARIETQLKSRFAIGSQVSEFKIIRDFLNQKLPEFAIRRVLQCMVRRGELQYRMQRRLLYRIH